MVLESLNVPLQARAAQRADLNLNEIISRVLRSSGVLAPFAWSTSKERARIRDAFASFLAAAARPFLQRGHTDEKIEPERLRQAIARVYGAWTLHPEDLELARQVAWLTHDFHKDVDPEGVVRGRLTDRLIEEKGMIYGYRVKTADDWENLLQLHTFLGLLFEADKNWGDEGTVRSSIAHWTYAIRAEERIRMLRQDPDYRAPGLYEHLAFCLTAKGRRQAAFDRFVEAGSGYLGRGNTLMAKGMAEAARKLDFTPTSNSSNRLTELESALARAQGADGP